MMKQEKYRVLLNSFLYTFNSILIKAISFLLLPFYTYFLRPKDYGAITLIAGFSSVASFIVAFSLYSAVSRFYADYKNDWGKLKRFYGTILSFVTLSGIVFVVFSLIFHNMLAVLFFKGLDFYPIVFWSIVGVFFSCIYTLYQNILQGMQNSKKYTITSIGYFLTNVTLNLLFIGLFKMGASGVVLAGLIANATFSVIVIFDLVKNDLVSFVIDKQMLKEALRYSIPILPHNLSSNIADFASRIIINTYSSLTSVGLFGVAMQFATVADTIQSSINMAFAPWFYETMNKEDQEGRSEIIRLSDFLIQVYGIIFLGIALFSQEAILLMTDDKYIMTWTVIPILLFSFSIKTIYYFYINVLFYYKEATKYIFISTLTGNLLNILTCFLLVSKLDLYGAALAQVVSRIVTVAIVIRLSFRFDNIGFKIYKMISYLIINASFGTVGLYFSYTKYPTEFNLCNFMFKLCVYFCYFTLIIFLFRKQITLILKDCNIKYFSTGKIIRKY